MSAAYTRIGGRIAALPAPLRGGLWMAAAGLCFAAMTAMIRPASAELDPLQVVFFRNLFGLILMGPLVMRPEVRIFTNPRIKMHMLRASLFLLAMACYFTAIPHVHLVDAVALSFSAPIFATVLAAVLLKEVVRARRWAAVAAGFLGVLVVVRPGFQELNPWMLLILADATIWAFVVIVIRSLAKSESPSAIVSNMFFWVTPFSLIPALFVWTWPGWETWVWLVAIALASTAGHLSVTRAFAAAEASAVLPFDYLRLLFFTAAGYVFFNEMPDEWTAVGAAIIVGSTFYIGRREARIAREAAAQAAQVRSPPAATAEIERR